MRDQGYLKFTGDYKKLKKMGFEFQKLYASNYMQWHKNHFRVWKKGSDITHDEYDLYQLVKFLKTNPKVKSYKDKDGNLESITFYKFRDSNSDRDYYYGERNEENSKRYADNQKAWLNLSEDAPDEDVPPSYDWAWVKKDTLDFLQELKDLDWYELVQYTEEQLA